MSIGIYKIVIPSDNGIKYYIGQSVNIQRRWNRHKNAIYDTSNPCYNYPLYRALRKYEQNTIQWEIIEECLISELNQREQYWIRYYNSNRSEFGYNLTAGGSSGHGMVLNQNQVDDIMELLRYSDLTIQELAAIYQVSVNAISSINNGGTWKQDDILYPIRPQKIREVNYCIDCGIEIEFNATRCQKCNGIAKRKADRPSSEELLKMVATTSFSEVGRIYNVTPNAVKKWCVNYGLPHLKKDLVALYTQKPVPSSIVVKTPITVIQQIDINTDCVLQEFPTAIAAARFLGHTSGAHIGKVCNGQRKTAFGYKWRRKIIGT